MLQSSANQLTLMDNRYVDLCFLGHLNRYFYLSDTNAW
jgi:hypothetical protein